MKKKLSSPKTSVSFEKKARKLLQNAAHAAPRLFFEKYRLVAVMLLLVAALMSGWVVWTFLFTEAQNPLEAAPPKEERLSVQLVDELELWLEERHTAYENPPIIPVRVFGN